MNTSSEPVLAAINSATEIRRICDLDEERGILSAAAYIIQNFARTTPGQKITLDIPAARKVVLDYVLKLLDADLFEAAATVLWGPDVYDWRPATSRACWKNLFEHDKLLIQGAGSMGKCEVRGTPILMADGTIKPVEDVRLGDQVMGPDWTPRTVLDLHSGHSQTYLVRQDRGMSYTVTEGHVMCVAAKGEGCPQVIDLPIEDLLVLGIDNFNGVRSLLYVDENTAPFRFERTCFESITPAGKQEYFGFALDGDHRFLLGDFTITHNSFSAAAWFYLDWLRDPDWTCIKVVSLTKEHAERNIFANIKNFHRSALVKPEFAADEKATAIMSNFDSKQGIHLVAIPKGESGHGTLRGFHPAPRGYVHPRWGKLSRTHVVLDEAEEVPSGVWEGVNNILSSSDTKAHPGCIKIFGASNPKDRTSAFGRRCEPVNGWGSIDCEEDVEWMSKDGYRVLRFDAARCENVMERKIVFPGLQTYEGFQSYLARGRTPESDTMARGWFPEEGAAMGIISPSMMDNAMGVVRFVGPVVPLAAFDLALEGNDSVVCSHGRFGLSDGWTDQAGQFHQFKAFRTMLQVDNQIAFPKRPTLEQAAAITQFCKDMKIAPGWLCVDRTGNGAGIHDSLVALFGREVMGVNYAWAATDTNILGDDSKSASELYSGVVTELLFGLSKYLEFEWIKINPNVRTEDLVKQATGRRYKQKGAGLVRVESKAEYCKRTRSPSPDALDSLSLLVFLMRQRSGVTATMVDVKPEPVNRFQKRLASIDDAFNFVDFSE